MIAEGVTRIDRRWLEDRGACEEHLELFAATFPDGGELSRANLTVAAKAGLDLDWLAQKILSGPARLAYEEARVTAWRAFQEGISPWGAYRKAIAMAFADALGLD